MKKAKRRTRASRMSESAGVIRSDSSRVLTRTSATAAVLAKAVMLSGNAQAQTAVHLTGVYHNLLRQWAEL